MLKVFNHRVYGMNESLIASGYPMRADSIGEWDEDELNNLKKWLEKYDLKYILKRLGYNPENLSRKTDVSWHRREPNEIKMSECKNHAVLVTRDNEGNVTGEFKIDLKDLHKIKDIKFNAGSNGYATSSNGLLHRIIKSEDGMITDHKNRDITDNRSANLRICTRQENNSNSASEGVSFRKDKNKWRAYIMVNKKQISLGLYETKEEALEARIEGELEYFGEFSKYYNHELDEKNDYGFSLALSAYKRLIKLGTVPTGTGHDNALKGIVVQFDVTYPVYWTPQFQRYNFADIVSSTSAMHRLHKLDLDESMNKYVLLSVKTILKSLIEAYNHGLTKKAKEIILVHPIGGDIVLDYFCDDETPYFNKETHITERLSMYELYMRILSNCPQGLMKTMRVSTNYLQLKTIYLQRRHHKLKEDWGNFCDWCETLPNFEEFCLKQEKK